jgi:DNA-directed RNA polymerase subunit beta'
VELHTKVKVKTKDLNEEGELIEVMLDTTVGRILFNEFVPKEVGYINTLLTKKSLRDIIGKVHKVCGTPKTAAFLDDIKSLGYRLAFEGGLSFNLQDVIIPAEKVTLVDEGYEEVEEVMNNYNMGFITNNERYNQIMISGHMSMPG